MDLVLLLVSVVVVSYQEYSPTHVLGVRRLRLRGAAMQREAWMEGRTAPRLTTLRREPWRGGGGICRGARRRYAMASSV